MPGGRREPRVPRRARAAPARTRRRSVVRARFALGRDVFPLIPAAVGRARPLCSRLRRLPSRSGGRSRPWRLPSPFGGRSGRHRASTSRTWRPSRRLTASPRARSAKAFCSSPRSLSRCVLGCILPPLGSTRVCWSADGSRDTARARQDTELVASPLPCGARRLTFSDLSAAGRAGGRARRRRAVPDDGERLRRGAQVQRRGACGRLRARPAQPAAAERVRRGHGGRNGGRRGRRQGGRRGGRGRERHRGRRARGGRGGCRDERRRRGHAWAARAVGLRAATRCRRGRLAAAAGRAARRRQQDRAGARGRKRERTERERLPSSSHAERCTRPPPCPPDAGAIAPRAVASDTSCDPFES